MRASITGSIIGNLLLVLGLSLLLGGLKNGVQVFDRNGRARGILPMPEGQPTSVCFGGAAFDTLFVTSGGRLYRRRMKSVGAPAFLAPLTLPPWGAG